MAEVASAFVSLMPSARGFGRQLDGQIAPQIARSGRGAGSRFGGFMAKGLKTGGLAVAAGATALIGTALTKGFGRLNAIDQARAKLVGLGHDAKDVNEIMANSLESVKGTAFGLDEAATVAATAVAAGVKPGRRLAKYLGLVADTAAITNRSLGEIGFTLNNVQTVGAAYNDTLQVLAQKGLPVYTLLSKKLGVSTREVKQLASEGKISADTLSSVLEKTVGGAALKTGATVNGAFKNLLASLGRIGANVLSGGFSKLPGLLTRITTALGPVETFSGKVGVALGKVANITFGNLSSAASSLHTFFTQGAGAPALAASMRVIRDAGNEMRDAFSVAATKLRAIKQTASGVDFKNIDTKALGRALADSVVEGVKSLGKITGAITDFFGKVDWVGLGIKVGTLALPFVVGLSTGIINGVGDPALWKGIWAHLPDILLAALAVAFLPSKVIGPIGRILTKIPFVGRFLAASLKWVNDLGKPLRGFAKDLFETFAKAFKGELPLRGLTGRILAGFRALAGKIGDFFGLLKTRLGVWALDAFEAMGRAAGRAVRGLFKVITFIPRRILAALGDVGSLLFNAGKELISGLIRGITSKLADLGSAMKKVASKVKGFLPGSPVKEGPLTSWNNGAAGKRLVGLLTSGIDAADTHTSMSRLAGRLSSVQVSPSVAVRTDAAVLPASTAGQRLYLVLDDGTQLSGYVDTRIGAHSGTVGMIRRAR